MEDILRAAGDGDLEHLEKIEARRKGSISAARDSERRTALHLAAGEGHTKVCEYLIARLGLHVDPMDLHGETPLYKANEEGHVETVRFLLTHKANPHAKSRLGITTLHQAATLGNLELIKILIAQGVALNSKSYKETPLACAVRSGSFDCFQALIQAGAAPEVVMYPLHAAVKSGSIDMVNWFLKNGQDPNACNSDGFKPIQLAVLHNNAEVVELLLPLTTRFLDTSDWTVPGVMKKGLLENERSQSVQMSMDALSLSDDEIEQKLVGMVLKNELVFFEGWSPMKKRLFFESTLVVPSCLKQISDHGIAGIKNSVIFDLTHKNKVQLSYLRAIHAYRSWHFSGSDLIYEIGPHRKRFCATRKDQTFVFWFRYLDDDVGLVIDGQSVWAEGMLRRKRDKNGRFTYKSPIQFRDAPKDGSSSSSKEKAPITPPYIVHSDLLEADYGGTYAGGVSDMKFSIDTARSSVVAISGHDKTKSLEKDCHIACDILVFIATEAGKNLWASQYTMHSFDPTLRMPIAVPKCFEGTVTNHQQVSANVLLALQTTAGKNLNDVPRGAYKIVNGAPFRTLWQCLDAYVILRRKAAFKTRFFLKGKEAEYRRQVKIKLQRQRHESDEEFAERVREARVRTGTLFDPKLHGGFGEHKLSICPKPLKPSRKRWYHVDEPYYIYDKAI